MENETRTCESSGSKSNILGPDNLEAATIGKGHLQELRMGIDEEIGYANMILANRDLKFGREIALVKTKLQEAKHWLNDALEIAE